MIARALHGQPDVTFIDLRDPRGLWRDGGIPGAKTAQDAGLTPVCHVAGGFAAWKKAGAPVDVVEPTHPGSGRA